MLLVPAVNGRHKRKVQNSGYGTELNLVNVIQPQIQAKHIQKEYKAHFNPVCVYQKPLTHNNKFIS